MVVWKKNGRVTHLSRDFRNAETGEEVRLTVDSALEPDEKGLYLVDGTLFECLENYERGQKMAVRVSDQRHVAHALPPFTPGAHSYAEDGTPRIDSQRDIDNIRRMNPALTWNKNT